MDHLVLDLAASDGSTAYFTIYSLGVMRDVGPGRVALLQVATPNGVVDHCFGEPVGVAARMQKRLKTIGAQRSSIPSVGIDCPPEDATIVRSTTSETCERWVVQSRDHVVSASWSDPEPALWLSAPAPAFHPTQDYFTTMISYRRAKLVIDGIPAAGRPFPHDLWQQRLGRPFSSCHAAFAESAVESS